MIAKVDGTNINPEINLKKSNPGKKGSIKGSVEIVQKMFVKTLMGGSPPAPPRTLVANSEMV